MTTQKALWLPQVSAEFTLGSNAIPQPGPGEVLVKLEASALNPVDWKSRKFALPLWKEYPAIFGADGAGVVEQVGEGVTNLAKGDRILFEADFNNRCTTFQEYCIAAADVAAKIPDNISFDQAASVPAGITSPAIAFYAQQPHGFALTAPFQEGGTGKYSRQPLVIMGGAGSLGQYAIQLARLSGFSPIITTASLHNRELLLSLGATHVVDRNLPTTAFREEVRKITGAPIMYAFDAVSIKDTQQITYDVLAPGGKLTVVLPPAIEEVEGGGKQVIAIFGVFQIPHNRELGVRFMRTLTKWLADGKIKPNIVEVLPGGLNGIPDGLKRLENNEVSGKKLVVRPGETV